MKLCWLTLSVILSTVRSQDELPTYIKPCSRNSDLRKCLLDNFATIRPHLSEGIPKLFVPKLHSSFPAPDLRFTNDTFSVELTDIKWTRQDVDVEDFNLILSNGTFDIWANLKRLDFESKYKIWGTLYGHTFEATEGYEYGGASNGRMLIRLRGKVVEGGRPLEFAKEEVKLLSWEGGYFNFTHANRERVRVLNEVTNENFLEFCSSMRTQFDKMVGTLCAEVVRNVFLHFSLNTLFPQ